MEFIKSQKWNLLNHNDLKGILTRTLMKFHFGIIIMSKYIFDTIQADKF